MRALFGILKPFLATFSQVQTLSLVSNHHHAKYAAGCVDARARDGMVRLISGVSPTLSEASFCKTDRDGERAHWRPCGSYKIVYQ